MLNLASHAIDQLNTSQSQNTNTWRSITSLSKCFFLLKEIRIRKIKLDLKDIKFGLRRNSKRFFEEKGYIFEKQAHEFILSYM